MEKYLFKKILIKIPFVYVVKKKLSNTIKIIRIKNEYRQLKFLVLYENLWVG